MPETTKSAAAVSSGRFAVVVSSYNAFLTDRLLEGALEALRDAGIEGNVDVFRVPGSFELPQMAGRAAETGRYRAIICLGALLRGETLHFELISSECARGIQEVAARYLLPVTFGVITADTLEQATARAGERSENKGWEAARAAVEMATIYGGLAEFSPAPGRAR